MTSALRRWFRRIFHVVRPGAGDAELNRELSSHLALLEDEHVRRGLAPEAARRAARLALGGVVQLRESHRDARSFGWLDDLRRDLVYAVRILQRSSAFSAVVTLTLALGIGSNVAIFRMVDAVMLRALPVRDPAQLVVIEWTANRRPSGIDTSGYGDCPDIKGAGVSSCSFSHPFVTHLAAANTTFSGVAAFASGGRFTVTGDGAANLARAVFVSGSYFDVLGVSALAGRTLQRADDLPGAPAAVVLSYAYWQHTLGGDPQIVGRILSLNGQPFTVAGVADPAFTHLTPGYVFDMWVPLSAAPRVAAKWEPKVEGADVFWIVMVARLKPGVSRTAAETEVAELFQQEAMSAAKPLFRSDDGLKVHVLPAQTSLNGVRGLLSQPLAILMTVVAAILLITCANVGGLMLARAAARQRESAIRLSLGASRSRLVRQALTESLALATAGGALALVLAYWTTGLLVLVMSNMAGGRELALNTTLDGRVVAFTLGVSLLSAVLLGVAPAWRGTQVELTPVLKDGSARRGVVRPRVRGRRALVVMQVALTVVVLTGTGLLVRTLQNLRSVDAGFQTSNLLTFGVDLGFARARGTSAAQLTLALRQQLADLPGVVAVSYSNDVLLSHSSYGTSFTLPENPTASGHAEWLAVGPHFVETVGLSIRLGRDFRVEDFAAPVAKENAAALPTLETPTPVLVNESFVRTYLPHVYPIDQVFGASTWRGGGWQIVGVVSDSKYDDLRNPVEPTFYRPLPEARYFEVRTAQDPAAILPSIRRLTQRADLPLFSVKTGAEQIDTLLAQQRLIARLSGFFGLLALALAGIGLYGLLSHEVSTRTREIGIRMALGANRTNVLSHVIGQGVSLSCIGIGVGVSAGLLATRYLRSLLFGVSSGDLGTLAVVAFLLIAVATVACLMPASRAARIDPSRAIRQD